MGLDDNVDALDMLALIKAMPPIIKGSPFTIQRTPWGWEVSYPGAYSIKGRNLFNILHELYILITSR